MARPTGPWTLKLSLPQPGFEGRNPDDCVPESSSFASVFRGCSRNVVFGMSSSPAGNSGGHCGIHAPVRCRRASRMAVHGWEGLEAHQQIPESVSSIRGPPAVSDTERPPGARLGASVPAGVLCGYTETEARSTEKHPQSGHV